MARSCCHSNSREALFAIEASDSTVLAKEFSLLTMLEL